MTTLSEASKLKALTEVQRLFYDVAGLRAVVLATVDGFDIASAIHGELALEPARLAAMASSISAISDVVSQEAALGRGKSVTIDTEEGFALVYAVQHPVVPLVINVIAGPDAVLGRVAYRVAQLAQTLAAI